MMFYRQTILLGPLDSLFGGGGSSSNATTDNQQVGAEGNSGPVFGAITTKGGAIKQVDSNTASSGGGGRKKKNQNQGSQSHSPLPTDGPPNDTNIGDIGGSNSNAPSSSDAGGGSGNVNIHVISGDSVAEGHNAAIAAQSIDAQNKLALATLGTAQGIAGLSFAFASQSQGSAMQNASDTLQAGQNLAALGIGTQAAEDLISPTGGAAVENGGKATKVLLVVSIIGTVLLLLKH